MAQLRPYKKVLRDLGRRQHSVKKRRQWLIQQKGRGCFKAFTTCYVNVLDHPANSSHVGESFTRRQSSH